MGLIKMYDFRELYDWYWAGVPTPKNLEPLDKGFYDMIVKTHEITGLGIDRVRFDGEADTAYTDLFSVTLPTCYLHWEMVQKVIDSSMYGASFQGLSNKDKFLVIQSIYNVFMIHENLHIEETEYMPKYKKVEFQVFNIIEDMFINYKAMGTPYNIFFKLFYSLFYNMELTAAISNIEKEGVIRGDYAQYFLNKLLELNYDYIVHGYHSKLDVIEPDTGFSQDEFIHFNRLLEGFDDLFELPFNERLEFVQDVYKFILRFMPLIQENLTDTRHTKGQGSLLDDGNDIPYDLPVWLEDKLTDIEVSLNELVEKEDYRVKYQKKENGNFATTIKIASVFNLRAWPVDKNKELVKFADVMRYQWGIQKQKVNAHKNGYKLNEHKLHNLSIDGRVFRKGREEKESLVKPQAIFLIDCSGSMSSILGDVLAAMYGISYGLTVIGYNHSIWGHTQEDFELGVKGCDRPILYHAYSYGMPDDTKRVVYNRDLESRIGKMKGIGRHGNEDYIAIKTVCNYFNGGSTKNLFVLSDGTPSPERGEIAIQETARVVQEMRKSVNVYSLSLVNSVVESNDKIYSQKYNFKAYGQYLTDTLKKIAEMLAKEK